MAAGRKLQAEIDKVLKKVDEGIEEFHQIWDNVHNATHANQREKFETELKTQIKKLQRDREQIKVWHSDKSVKDKNALADARKKIEVEMEKFKEFERDLKTKTYSKEGLSKSDKMDPIEEERQKHRHWIQESIDKLNVQVDEMDADIEAQAPTVKKTKKKGSSDDKNEESAAVVHLKHVQETHRWHITKLEQLLRKIENDGVNLEEVDGLRENVEYYIDDNSRADGEFQEFEEIYEGLALENIEDYLAKADREKSEKDTEGEVSSLGDRPESSAGGDRPGGKDDGHVKQEPKAPSKHAGPAAKPPNSPATTAAQRRSKEETGGDSEKHSEKKPPSTWPPIMSVWSSPTPTTTAQTSAPPPKPGPPPPSAASRPPGPSLPPPNQPAPDRPPPPGQAPVLNAPPNQPPPKQPPMPHQQPPSAPPKPAPHQPPHQPPPPSQAPPPTQAPPQPPMASPPSASPPRPSGGPPPAPSAASGGGLAGILGSVPMPAPPPMPPPAPSDGAGAASEPPSSAPPPPPPPLMPPPPPSPVPSAPNGGGSAAPGAGAAAASSPAVKRPPHLAEQAPQWVPPTGGAPFTGDERQAPKVPVPTEAPPPPSESPPPPPPSSSAAAAAAGGHGAGESRAAASRTSTPTPSVGSHEAPAGAPPPPPPPPAAVAAAAAAAASSSMRDAAGASAAASSSSPRPGGGASASELLSASFRNLPCTSDGRRKRKYVPRNPYVHVDTRGNTAYPVQPTRNYESPEMFEKYDLDTLFFIFYYQQGSYQQHLAAKELKKMSWRYHTKYLTWFQRHEEPKQTASNFERGAYVYFDHDSGWCQRIKQDFSFEYMFLEDEPM